MNAQKTVINPSIFRELRGLRGEALPRFRRELADPHHPPAASQLYQSIGRWVRVRFRGGPEQGGYVHDTAVSVLVPPRACIFKTGTWTDTAGNVANTYMVRKTAAADTTIVVIPVAPLQNAAAYKGSYLKSLDVWWENATAGLTTLTPVLYRATLPADTAAYAAPAAVTFTYDGGHDTNPKRVTVEQHTMTLTVSAPFWLANTDQVYVELTVVAAAGSVFDFYGARANLTVRL